MLPRPGAAPTLAPACSPSSSRSCGWSRRSRTRRHRAREWPTDRDLRRATAATAPRWRARRPHAGARRSGRWSRRPARSTTAVDLVAHFGPRHRGERIGGSGLADAQVGELVRLGDVLGVERKAEAFFDERSQRAALTARSALRALEELILDV